MGRIRSDERIRNRVGTWLLMPLAVVFAWTVLRCMRWYGAATCANTGWGTRQGGAEVSLGGPSSSEPGVSSPPPAPEVFPDFPDWPTQTAVPVAPLEPLTETTLELRIQGADWR